MFEERRRTLMAHQRVEPRVCAGAARCALRVHHCRAPIRRRHHAVAEALPSESGPVYNVTAHPGVKEVVLVLGLDAHRHAARIVCNPGTYHGGAVGSTRGNLQLACRLVNAPGLEWRPAFAASAQREQSDGERHLPTAEGLCFTAVGVCGLRPARSLQSAEVWGGIYRAPE